MSLIEYGIYLHYKSICLFCFSPIAGEFMQLGSKENENERFEHYLQKTYKKTASLIAQSCKAVSIN